MTSRKDNDEPLKAVVFADSCNPDESPSLAEGSRLANAAILTWQLAALARFAVKQVVILSSKPLTDVYTDPLDRLQLTFLSSPAWTGEGDALRDLEARDGVRPVDDFILVRTGCVFNLDLRAHMAAHKERRHADRNWLITTLFRQTTGSVSTRLTIAVDKHTNTLVKYAQNPAGETAPLSIDLRADAVNMHKRPARLDIYVDVLDVGLDICAPEFLLEFRENFYYTHVRSYIEEKLEGGEAEVFGNRMYAHLINSSCFEYATRITSLDALAQASCDVLNDWMAPVHPLPTSDTHRRKQINDEAGNDANYITDRIILGDSVVIGIGSTIVESVIGNNVTIGSDVTIMRSVIGDGCIIGDRSDISHTITAADCQVQSDCTVPRNCFLDKGVCVGLEHHGLSPYSFLTLCDPEALHLQGGCNRFVSDEFGSIVGEHEKGDASDEQNDDQEDMSCVTPPAHVMRAQRNSIQQNGMSISSAGAGDYVWEEPVPEGSARTMEDESPVFDDDDDSDEGEAQVERTGEPGGELPSTVTTKREVSDVSNEATETEGANETPSTGESANATVADKEDSATKDVKADSAAEGVQADSTAEEDNVNMIMDESTSHSTVKGENGDSTAEDDGAEDTAETDEAVNAPQSPGPREVEGEKDDDLGDAEEAELENSDAAGYETAEAGPDGDPDMDGEFIARGIVIPGLKAKAIDNFFSEMGHCSTDDFSDGVDELEEEIVAGLNGSVEDLSSGLQAVTIANIDADDGDDGNESSFTREVSETIERALKEKVELDNTMLEVNSLKMAYHSSFPETLSNVVAAIAQHVHEASSDETVYTAFALSLREHKKLIDKFNQEDNEAHDTEVANGLADLLREKEVLLMYVLKAMFDQDIIEEEGILAWSFAERQRAEDGTVNDSLLKTLQPFLDWLQVDDDDDDDDE